MARRKNNSDYAKGASAGENDFDLSMEPGFDTKTRAELKRAGKSSDYIRGYLAQVKKEEDEFDAYPPATEDDLYANYNPRSLRKNYSDYERGAEKGEDDVFRDDEIGITVKSRSQLKRAGKSSDYIRGYLEYSKRAREEIAMNMPREKNTSRRKTANPMRLLENPYGLSMGKGKAIRVGKGGRTHVKKGQYALCGAGEKSGDVRPSAAKIITCYRCIKLININAGHDVDRNLRYGKRTKHLMIPGGREGAWVAGRDDHRYPMPDFASMVGSEKYPTQDRDIAKRLKTKRRSAKTARAGKRARRMVSNPKRGTLEDQYNNYVDAMISMGRAYVDFDTWLNR
jgi:hypothetical protein